MEERRRSRRRMPIQATVQVIGMKPGSSGSTAIPAQIVDVSDHGALIECRSQFDLLTDLMIQLQDNHKSSLAVVVRTAPTDNGWRMGIELIGASGKDFWGEG